MPSHLSTIGFPVNSSDEVFALAQGISEHTEATWVDEMRYQRWSGESGAELWLEIDDENDLVGVTPHFSGKARMRVGITKSIVPPDSNGLDGGFYGWANPDNDDPETGYYPFVFDVPDFLCKDISFPTVVTVQIAAFAYEVSLFESEDTYASSQTMKPYLASKSFIPSGLFKPGGEAIVLPEAEAIFVGHILEAEMRTNDWTGQRFYYVLVESLGGLFDVVIDPVLIDSIPRVGGILSGTFWLSGRIMD